jgi:uncharacterized cupin superfamily protein
MAAIAVLKLGDRAGPGESCTVAPEKRVSGNPLQTVWLQYTDPSKRFLAGIWRSEPGAWMIHYTEEEYCVMLEGVSVITDAAGASTTVLAGERFIVPRGFVGTWEVVETTTKQFVIYEAPP